MTKPEQQQDQIRVNVNALSAMLTQVHESLPDSLSESARDEVIQRYMFGLLGAVAGHFTEEQWIGLLTFVRIEEKKFRPRRLVRAVAKGAKAAERAQ